MEFRLNSNGLWNIVKIGTIGWMKCMDNTIRQCKCVNVYFVKCGSFYTTQYEWQIGGMGVRRGSCSRIEKVGIIYQTEKNALVGHGDTAYCHQDNEMFPNIKIDILYILKQKYGLSNYCIEREMFSDNHYHLRTFGVMQDNSVALRETDFFVTWSEKGVIDVVIPMLEGEVNGIRRYPTREIANQHVRKLKVYTLDDEIENDIAPITKVKVTIEVETTNLENIKKIAKILN